MEVCNEIWPFPLSSSSFIITDFSNRIKSLKIRWDFCIMLILSFFSSKLQTAPPVLLWVLPHHCIGCLPLNILIYFLIFSFVLQLFEYTFLDFLLQMTFYKNQNETYSSLSHLGPVSFFCWNHGREMAVLLIVIDMVTTPLQMLQCQCFVANLHGRFNMHWYTLPFSHLSEGWQETWELCVGRTWEILPASCENEEVRP